VLPSEFLWPPSAFKTADQPRISAISPGDGVRAGSIITLTGRGFGESTQELDVFFQSVAMSDYGVTRTGEATRGAVLSRTPTEIRVVVPPVAESGEMQVTVAVEHLLSAAVKLDVEASPGLLASYTAGDTAFADLQLPAAVSTTAAREGLTGEEFEVTWRGHFWAHETGNYRFDITSAGALTVDLGGKRRLSTNGGAIARTEMISLMLDAGRHELTIRGEFSRSAPIGCDISVVAPSSGPFALRPVDVVPPADLDLGDRPVIRSLTPSPLTPGGTIRITGDHLTGDSVTITVPTGARYTPTTIAAESADGGGITATLPADLAPGQLTVTVDLNRSAPVTYELANPTGAGLRGEYYRLGNATLLTFPDLTGRTPFMIRTDAQIDFHRDAEFALPVTPENFVIRWTGGLRIDEAGTYTFRLGSDDGSRFALDGALIIDNDGIKAYLEVESQPLTLTAGTHPLRVDFFENFGEANCRLLWRKPGSDNFEPIPAANFVTGE
jgi:hypothetical protein